MADPIIHSEDGQTYDLTQNRIAFGMLPKDVQDALYAWPHGIEMYGDYGTRWTGVTPAWRSNGIYRATPAPKEYVLYWTAGLYAAPDRASCHTHRITIRVDGTGNFTATVEEL